MSTVSVWSLGKRLSIAFVAAGAVGAVLAFPGRASANAPTPYSDPAARGVITLCDAAGQQVVTGSITSSPFVFKAVGPNSAPKIYQSAGATAAVFAYQPRPDVDPGDWSGEQLISTSRSGAATSTFDDLATSTDGTLAQFLGSYPAMVQGLVQLRIYAGAPGEPFYSSTYPALDIRVTGDTWTALEMGTDSCGTNSARPLYVPPSVSPTQDAATILKNNGRAPHPIVSVVPTSAGAEQTVPGAQTSTAGADTPPASAPASHDGQEPQVSSSSVQGPSGPGASPTASAAHSAASSGSHSIRNVLIVLILLVLFGAGSTLVSRIITRRRV